MTIENRNNPQVMRALPQEGLVRLEEALGVIPVSRSTWFAGQAKNRFPKPVSLGPRTRAYRVEDIRAYIANPEGWVAENAE